MIVSHGRCGKRWNQRGNRTGHCSACHETFEGSSLFDAHQRCGSDGKPFCLVPADMEHPKGWPLKQEPEYGVWSSSKPYDVKHVKEVEHEQVEAEGHGV